MTGIILAGGKGSRLGNKNKALIKVGKFSIIEGIIMKLKKAEFEEIIICGGIGEWGNGGMREQENRIIHHFPFLPLPHSPTPSLPLSPLLHPEQLQGVITIEDIIPHFGPLVGLYSGLISSNNFYNFVVGCDMPFLSINLIKYMKDKIGDADVVIPKTKEGIEPLHAIYSKNCLNIIEKKIRDEKEKHSLRSIFSELKIKYISEKEILQFSLPEIAFFNINTSQNIEEARRLVEELEE